MTALIISGLHPGLTEPSRGGMPEIHEPEIGVELGDLADLRKEMAK